MLREKNVTRRDATKRLNAHFSFSKKETWEITTVNIKFLIINIQQDQFPIL